jgi:hypothetical protein
LVRVRDQGWRESCALRIQDTGWIAVMALRRSVRRLRSIHVEPVRSCGRQTSDTQSDAQTQLLHIDDKKLPVSLLWWTGIRQIQGLTRAESLWFSYNFFHNEHGSPISANVQLTDVRRAAVRGEAPAQRPKKPGVSEPISAANTCSLSVPQLHCANELRFESTVRSAGSTFINSAT